MDHPRLAAAELTSPASSTTPGAALRAARWLGYYVPMPFKTGPAGELLFEQRPGHVVDQGVAWLELQRLLAFVLADRARVELAGERDDGVLLQLFDGAELTRLLLSTAILLRSKDERLHAAYGADYVKERRESRWSCGTLQITGGATSDLCIREACNKIIHADTTKFAEGPDDPEFQALASERCYLLPLVTLTGVLGKTSYRHE